MLKIIMTVLVLVLGAESVLGHEHSPTPPLWTFEGQDAATKEECFLFVSELSQTGSAFYAVVSTSYTHDHESPQALRVQATPDRPEVLSGTAENGQDQIAIFLNSTDLDLRKATSFHLKWLHGNHFHTNRCLNLQVHEK